MRKTLFVTGCALLSAGVGCKWTDFDDLEKDTWVSSTDKPNGDSTDYGVAIQRGQRGSNGGKLVVIGAGQAQYTELVYSPNGDSDLAPTALKLNTQFGIGNLDQQPILIADGTNDEVSLVVNSGGQSIAVLTGTGGLLAHQIFGPEQPDAATYMVPPPRADLPALPTPAQVLVGSVDTLYGGFVQNTPNPQTKCQLQDEAASVVTVRGLGATRVTSATYDDVVVWGTVGGNAGKLLLYPGTVFNGNPPVGTCLGGIQQPLAASVGLATPFVPAKGSQIVMVDPLHFLAVGHKDLGNAESFLGFYTIDPTAKTITATGAAVTLADLRTATVLTVGGSKKYVVAGYPTSIVENVKAGRVLVFPLDLTAGIDATPAAQLYDSQPEDNQQFGRGVAAMPFNGDEVVAVAADNEIFVYFELGPSASNPPMGSIYGDKRVR
jgi:hypothetical protein